MNSLPKDEFALEMRNHFIETCTEALKSLKSPDDFALRFADLCTEWSIEANSNELPWFAKLVSSYAELSKNKDGTFDFQQFVPNLLGYLTELNAAGDSEVLLEKWKQAAKALAVEDSEEPTQTYLQCRFSDHRFLLPVDSVVEISQLKKVNGLPLPRQHIKGLLAFRGFAIPLVDLAHLGFGFSDEKTFLVICEHDKSFFAMEVNATEDVLTLKASDIQTSSEQDAHRFVTKDKHIFLLLDIQQLVAA